VNPGARFTPLVSNVLPGRQRPRAPGSRAAGQKSAGSIQGPDLGELPRHWPQACPNVGTRMPSPVGAGRKLRAW